MITRTVGGLPVVLTVGRFRASVFPLDGIRVCVAQSDPRKLPNLHFFQRML